MSDATRFWSKVDKSADCWLWTAGKFHAGYGAFCLDGGMQYAHRLAYEWLVGPIPTGLTIDHLCHNRDETCPGGDTCPHRACVNPDHLEPVPTGVNTNRSPRAWSRKTHCPRGHAYTPDNMYRNSKGWRWCKTCALANAARQNQQRKMEARV